MILTPGQDLLLVLSYSISQGSRAGVVTASGISTGLLGHSLLAAFGLGTLLLASESLFIMIKLVGAAYLMYLGLRMLLRKNVRITIDKPREVAKRRLFLSGAFSNISNPHVTLFYFAFLPQFIPDSSHHPTLLLFVLGIGFAMLTLLVKGMLGYFAGNFAGWIQAHPSVLNAFEKLSGMALMTLGLKLAFGSRG